LRGTATGSQRALALAPRLDAFADLMGYREERRPGLAALRVFVRHPFVSGRGLAAVARLPSIDVPLSDGPAGRLIRARLSRHLLRIPTGRLARATLALPDEATQYLRGRSRQAVRTNLHRARDLGLACSKIDAIDEQARLCGELLLDRGWGDRPLERLAREHGVRPGTGTHYAATGPAGRSCAVAVVLEDELTACLVWMMATPDHAAASAARYALSAHLIMDLAARHRRLLLVADPISSSSGVRYFQRRLGFELRNLRLVPISGTPIQHRQIREPPRDE